MGADGHHHRHWLCLALVLAALTAMAAATPETRGKPQLLVLLLDGARWDYVDQMADVELGGFKILKEHGVRTEYLEPVTPSMSFPNWRTLGTGLYPEGHHVLGNTVYDRATGASFSFQSSPDEVLAAAPWWQDVEPIWVTATRQGKRVATIGWGRSDVPVQGVLPEVAQGFPGPNKHNFAARVIEAAGYLQEGFDLVLMHFDDVDHEGHENGPASPQVMQVMRDVGVGLKRLFESIAHLPNVHVMVVADHGMTRACSLPPVELSKYIDINRDTEMMVSSPGFISLYARENCASQLYEQLQSVPGWEVRLKKHIPEEFHLKSSCLAPDLVLFARPDESGCAKSTNVNANSDANGDFNRNSNGNASASKDASDTEGGQHGPAPALFHDMRGLFLVKGEAFVGGGRVFPPIRSVDVYQIYCHILGIKPRPHHGSWEAVRGMLKDISNSFAEDRKDDGDGCPSNDCSAGGFQHSANSERRPGGDAGGHGGGMAEGGGVSGGSDGGGGGGGGGGASGGGNQRTGLEIAVFPHGPPTGSPPWRGRILVNSEPAWATPNTIPAVPPLCQPGGPFLCHGVAYASPYVYPPIAQPCQPFSHPRCRHYRPPAQPQHFRGAGVGCHPYERRMCLLSGRDWYYYAHHSCVCVS